MWEIREIREISISAPKYINFIKTCFSIIFELFPYFILGVSRKTDHHFPDLLDFSVFSLTWPVGENREIREIWQKQLKCTNTVVNIKNVFYKNTKDILRHDFDSQNEYLGS